VEDNIATGHQTLVRRIIVYRSKITKLIYKTLIILSTFYFGSIPLVYQLLLQVLKKLRTNDKSR